MKILYQILGIMAAVFLLFCGSCAAATEWTPVTVTDSHGTEVTISEYPEKLISLTPVSTEIIYAIGAGDRLIADTTYCNYPEAAKSLEKIGEFSELNRERIIALADGPTVIFGNQNNGRDTIDYLRKQGLTVLIIDPSSIDTIYSAIRIIGDAVGNSKEAETEIARIQEGIRNITDRLAGITEKPTVMHALSTEPCMVSGSSTFQDELIELAGAENAFSDVSRWKSITLERLLITDPDIILTDSGYDMGTSGENGLLQEFYDNPQLNQLSAVKNRKIYAIDSDIFDRGGPRVVEALSELVKITHPELFGTASVSETRESPGFGIAAGIAGILGTVLIIGRRRF